MKKDLPFNVHAAEYDEWFDKYPFVFESELEVIRKAWPATGNGLKSLEIGCATGRFAKALGITEGLDPAPSMCDLAEKRGVNTWCGIAESLPYVEDQFDVVLMNNCISYIGSIRRALNEVYRVLKPGGVLLVGFIEKNSQLGRYYDSRRAESIFYRDAAFYTVDEIRQKLNTAGFSELSFLQTLFDSLDNIRTVQESQEGFDKGSYILVKAIKPLAVHLI